MANYLLSHTGAQIDEAVSLALAGVQDESVTTPKLADGAVTTIKIADASVQPAKLSTGHPTWDTGGTLSATAFSGPLTGAYQGGFRRGLKVTTTGRDKYVYVTADQLLVTASSGLAVVLNNVSIGMDSTIVGANGLDTGTLAASTWYSVWVINNPTTVSTVGLLSLSATAPALPSGYIYSTRVGWIRTDGTANKYPLAFMQYGRRVQYIVSPDSNVTIMPQAASGVAGTTGFPWHPVAVSMANFVPSTSFAAVFSLSMNSANNVMLASNSSKGSSPSNPTDIWNEFSGAGGVLQANIVLESLNVYYASNAATGVLAVSGWEDNL